MYSLAQMTFVVVTGNMAVVIVVVVVVDVVIVVVKVYRFRRFSHQCIK